jgi:hypothetical protein
MNHFIQRLPIDIILQIIPYTYNLQNKNLLNDIINYKETQLLLLDLYQTYWIIMYQQLKDSEESKYWLINDIFAYANDNNATIYGYIDNFYNIFKRNISLQTIETIDKYVSNLEEKKVKTQINIFLGLLNIDERNDLVILFYNKLN